MKLTGTTKDRAIQAFLCKRFDPSDSPPEPKFPSIQEIDFARDYQRIHGRRAASEAGPPCTFCGEPSAVRDEELLYVWDSRRDEVKYPTVTVCGLCYFLSETWFE